MTPRPSRRSWLKGLAFQDRTRRAVVDKTPACQQLRSQNNKRERGVRLPGKIFLDTCMPYHDDAESPPRTSPTSCGFLNLA